jgi:CoA:oxalate CoA-transferase
VQAAGPLAGIFIVDLTRVLAGPYCTMVLADLGARVVKVESPAGDDARRIGPFVNGVSAYFASLNRGKQSIALDLKDAADRAIFDALVARADVLIENFRPGVMQRLGYGWEVLAAKHPSLVMASVSGFGQTGPYATRPAYDVVVQAMGGIMSLTGELGGEPARVGTSLGDIGAGLFSAIGIQAALVERARTGVGRHIDVGMLDCQVAMLENAIARYRATGNVPGPLGTRHPSIAPFQALRASDGHVVVAAGNDALFAKLCAAIGRSALASDARFVSNALRTENVDALAVELETVLATAGVTHWLERLEAAGIPCGPLNDVAAVLDDPQVRARNMIITSEDPTAGTLTLAGNPVKLSGVEDPPTRPAAPALDADRRALLDELGLS